MQSLPGSPGRPSQSFWTIARPAMTTNNHQPRHDGVTVPLDFLISAIVTLFVVVDPVGLVPTFVAVTAGLPAAARRQVAVRACVIASAAGC